MKNPYISRLKGKRENKYYMKKLTTLLLAIAIVVMPSCKNRSNNNTKEEAPDYAQASLESLTNEALKTDMANLLESAKHIKAVPFLKAQKDGKISLSDKEKMVKPDFLVAPDVATGLVTLNQKYRAVGILTSDKAIAELYEMPVASYSENIFKLLTDINDPALMEFYTLPSFDIESNREAFSVFVDDEYAAGRINYFWEGVTAGLVEQLFILTRNIDKFMPMFTDELASDITYNFVCVHDGLTKTVNATPEMASLNEVLEPLYAINAISVEQLRAQLTDLKDEIEAARAALLN